MVSFGYKRFVLEGYVPGLLALKRKTMLPLGYRTKVSRRIGMSLKSAEVTLESSNVPASSSERQTAWKLWPWRWNGCLPESRLSTTTWTISSFSRTKL